MRSALVSLCLAAAIVLTPASVNASHDPSGEPFDEDFVSTVAPACLFQPPPVCSGVHPDARSGPEGENPTGFSTWGERFNIIGGEVSCLTVTGSRAVIGARNQLAPIAVGLFLEVEDNSGGGAPDAIGFVTLPEIPGTCPTPDELDLALRSIAPAT
jgi:hypothetical protein